MDMISVIIIILLFYYFIIRPRRPRKNQASTTSYQNPVSVQQSQTIDQPTPGINRCPADALINSPYYLKYKRLFDSIWYDGEQPKYKIDWLLQSLDMGRELESSGEYVLKSIERGLPYFCETVVEYSYFDAPHCVELGSIKGMVDICFLYAEVSPNYSHPAKRRYWQQRLRDLALSGNLEAQGALCCSFVGSAFSKEEAAKFREKYEASLFSLAESGNAFAQLAVAEFLMSESQEKIEWLVKAANQGLSDAWYELSKSYHYQALFDERGNAKPPLTKQEKADLDEKVAECHYRGAVANNGAMAAYCQERVGTYYEDGDSIFPKDIAKAKYWYQKALENGLVSAKYDLKSINDHPEWY